MHHLRNESTPEAREIWRKVDEVASKVPEWLRKQVDEVVAQRLAELAQRPSPAEPGT